MSFLDDYPDDHPIVPTNDPEDLLPVEHTELESGAGVQEHTPEPLGGDPIFHAANSALAITAPTVTRPPRPSLPEDLQVSWSWPHLILFLFFGFASLLVVQTVMVIYLGSTKHLSAKQIQQVFESNPKLIVGSNVLWFALMLLFLYVTLGVLRDLPFWKSLGWKKLRGDPRTGKRSPWWYFFSGSGLAIFVAIASSRVKNTDHVPIQDLFKSRSGAFALMAMAVLVAPLVEETIFRGYLYPFLATKFSHLAENLGVDSPRALRYGVFAGVVVTGTLFGLMHGAQLGWTWGLVSLLIVVGIIFTFARAWTGTVVASFLLHLGYNSFLAISSILATKGFTHMPPGQ